MSAGLEILYVDDEPDIRTIAVMALELEDGISVRTAASGPEALALVASGNLRPDVVLLDVMMPGMDGPQLLAELRKVQGFEAIPVIFMTAKARGDDVARYRELGAIGVVSKPFDPMTLAGQVRALLAIRREA